MPATENAHRQRATFRRSTNVAADSAQAANTLDYIASACARQSLERLVVGFSNDGPSRAWTITGPYGSGKSSFVLFASALLAGSRHPLHAQMSSALKAVDTRLYDRMRRLTSAGGLLPVLVTGSSESIRDSIKRAAIDTLNSCKSAAARRLRAQWLADSGPGRFGTPVEGLIKLHECVLAHEEGVAGTLVVIDELGKLLEFSVKSPDKSDVYALQELAEAASRTTAPMLLVGVLHQDFSAYAHGLPARERQEWEKIRGRFEDILFDEPADQMLRLLARSVDSDGPTGPDEQAWKHAVRAMQKAGSLPRGLEKSEVTELLKRCWPLHPVTAVVLGAVFKRYGQNERSAFSFVQSREPFGLRDFVARSSAAGMYTLAHLFEYMTSTLGDNLLSNRDGKRWAEAIDLDRRLIDCGAETVSTFRTIAMLGIIGRWHDLAATTENVEISVAPAVDARGAATAIADLRARSVIVLRKFNGTLALWEGSDVDIEAKLGAARATLPAALDVADTLTRFFRPRPVIARRHSFETGTLRVFSVDYVNAQHLDTATRQELRGDGRIMVVFADDAVAPVVTGTTGEQSGNPRQIIAVPSNTREIASLARELAAIEAVRKGTPELAGDSTARRELDARESEVRRRLASESSAIMYGDGRGSTTRWYIDGKAVRVRDARELNELLSVVCDGVYEAAPIIRNEIINRMELSSSAAAARRNLIEAMIEHQDTALLGIEGNPPEKSIYLSVLRELGLHIASSGSFRFSADARRAKNKCGALLRGIHAFLSSAEAERKSVAALFDMLRQPPYGLRDGVLPVLLCAVLQACESELALYEDGAFLPQLSIESFERLMKTPDNFALRRWRLSGVRTTVFQQLAAMLGTPEPADLAGRDDVLDVVRPMLRFYRRLEQFTQTTRSVSPETASVRSALATATEPDQLLFVELPQACGVPPFDSSSRGRDRDVTRFVTVLQQSLGELQRAYDGLLSSVQASLAAAFATPTALPELRRAITARARAIEGVAVDPEVRSLVERMLESGTDDRQWLESLAALLVAKPPPAWRDEDRARFEVALAQRVRRLRALEVVAREHASSEQLGPGSKTFRLAVAGSAMKDHEVVLHVSDAQSSELLELTTMLRSHLNVALNGFSQGVVLAALAQLVGHVIGSDAQGASISGGVR